MTKVAGFQGFLKRNTTGSTYVTVGQIMSIGPVGFERDLIDVTAHLDTWEDNLAGVLRGRVMELTIAFDPGDGQHTAMFTDATTANQTARNYELQHTAFATRAVRFPALITAWEEEATDSGAYEAHVSLKVVNPGMSAVTPS